MVLQLWQVALNSSESSLLSINANKYKVTSYSVKVSKFSWQNLFLTRIILRLGGGKGNKWNKETLASCKEDEAKDQCEEELHVQQTLALRMRVFCDRHSISFRHLYKINLGEG